MCVEVARQRARHPNVEEILQCQWEPGHRAPHRQSRPSYLHVQFWKVKVEILSLGKNYTSIRVDTYREEAHPHDNGCPSHINIKIEMYFFLALHQSDLSAKCLKLLSAILHPEPEPAHVEPKLRGNVWWVWDIIIYQFLIANLFLRIKDNTALRNEENFSIQTYSIQHLILDNDVLAAWSH